MRLPWWRAAKAVESSQVPCTKTEELETAKEILAEVFQVRLSEVDNMIKCRFEAEDKGSEEDGLWPQEFWLER